MKWIAKLFASFSAALLCLTVCAENITVDPEKCVIVHPAVPNGVQMLSAKLLQKHLGLISGGCQIPIVPSSAVPSGKYAFFIATPPGNAGKVTPLSARESRWSIKDSATYFWGDDVGFRRGSMNAVSMFLERQFGVLWIEPGDDGIVYNVQTPFKMNTGDFSWTPQIVIRTIRGGVFPPITQKELLEFNNSKEEQAKATDEWIQWEKWHKECHREDDVPFGHSFTCWWKMYHTTHPEYFALNKYGKREPIIASANKMDPIAVASGERTIKMCVSCQGLVKQVVENWSKLSPRPKGINICENDDVGGYCRCDECRKLDGRYIEDIDSHTVNLADRYLHFAKEVLKEGRKIDPDVKVTMYIYNHAEWPPLREKAVPGIVFGSCPRTLNLQQLETWLKGWKDAGMVEFTFRPNYHWCFMTSAIPFGLEKHFTDATKLAVKYGAIGIDFDSSMRNWSISGVTDYVLFRTIQNPAVPFEVYEEEYYSAFGCAAPAVKKYFQYWRKEVFEKRVLPDFDKIVEKGRYGNFARGLLWMLKDYYHPEDFERAGAFLKNQSTVSMTKEQRARFERLLLAHQHAVLLYDAITADAADKNSAALKLLQFRKKYRTTLKMNWKQLFVSEQNAGVTAIPTIAALAAFDEPCLKTSLFWKFKLDPEDKGVRENWQQTNWKTISKEWKTIATDSSWENLSPNYVNIPDDLRQALKKYDGIGWYAENLRIPADWKDSSEEIYLCFGAVDESCQVFINGKKAGEHLFLKGDDWCVSFSIPISRYINWKLSGQTVVVRVEDKQGDGGIWKTVWLVRRKKQTR